VSFSLSLSSSVIASNEPWLAEKANVRRKIKVMQNTLADKVNSALEVKVDYSATNWKQFVEKNVHLTLDNARQLWQKEVQKRQDGLKALFAQGITSEATYKQVGGVATRGTNKGFATIGQFVKVRATAEMIQAARIKDAEASAKKDAIYSQLYSEAQGYKA